MPQRCDLTNRFLQHEQGVVEEPVSPVTEPIVRSAGDRDFSDNSSEGGGSVVDVQTPMLAVFIEDHTYL